jgi:uncharacterized protein CbrC (UPF0167 family)
MSDYPKIETCKECGEDSLKEFAGQLCPYCIDNRQIDRIKKSFETEIICKDTYIAQLEEERDELILSLKECTDSFEYYAQYAGDYLQEKHGVANEVKRYRDLINNLESK